MILQHMEIMKIRTYFGIYIIFTKLLTPMLMVKVPSHINHQEMPTVSSIPDKHLHLFVNSTEDDIKL